MARKADSFLLSELPQYTYPINVCCPECYKPLQTLKRRDGRCDDCLKSKAVLPVNHLRVKKRKTDEDDEDNRRARRYNGGDDED